MCAPRGPFASRKSATIKGAHYPRLAAVRTFSSDVRTGESARVAGRYSLQIMSRSCRVERPGGVGEALKVLGISCNTRNMKKARPRWRRTETLLFAGLIYWRSRHDSNMRPTV